MRKFIVNVNGSSYEVEVEEIASGTQSAAAPAAAAPAAAPAKKESAPKKPVPAAKNGKAEKVTAPMPGNILEVKVKPGDKIKKGAVLVVLEAMKMENEIMASADGVIVDVNVQKGTVVNSGDVLCTIG